jgi:hypothetical protein
MGNHEENEIQQEIIDSLAKKVTDLEKRQAKVEQTELSAIPNKVEELEKKISEVSEMRTLENAGQLERFDKQLGMFDAKINAIPKDIPVKHSIQFEAKSKFVIKILIGLGLLVAVLVAILTSLVFENINRKDESNKFLILRGFYPDVAKQIDSVFAINSDLYINKAKENIDQQLSVAEATNEAQQADKKLRELKRKHQPSK